MYLHLIERKTYSIIQSMNHEKKASYIVTKSLAEICYPSIQAIANENAPNSSLPAGCAAIGILFFVGLLETPFLILEGPIDIIRAVRSGRSKK